MIIFMDFSLASLLSLVLSSSVRYYAIPEHKEAVEKLKGLLQILRDCELHALPGEWHYIPG